MKSKFTFGRNVFLICGFVCTVLISTVAQGGSDYLRYNHHPPGRLIVDRAPNFGWNIAFNLQIDGRPVADVVQGRSYSAWLPAGSHVLSVSALPAASVFAYGGQSTSVTVNIQPGAEHLYVAMWDSGLVYLHPAGVSVTPGAYWQLHGDGAP